MTRPPVLSKPDMYRRLRAGEFGNTTPGWNNVDDWILQDEVIDCVYWGIRSTITSGHPNTAMYIHQKDIPKEVYKRFPEGNYDISPIVDSFIHVNAFLNIWDSPSGLIVEAVEHPGRRSWRQAMPTADVHEGIKARMVLRRLLNENSLDDLDQLLELYPSHIIEISALEICFGTRPHRNGIVWEVREGTTGLYESWR